MSVAQTAATNSTHGLLAGWLREKQEQRRGYAISIIPATAGAACIGAGWMAQDFLTLATGVAAASYFTLRWMGWRPGRAKSPALVEKSESAAALAAVADPQNLDNLVDDMLRQGRAALMLRPQLIANLSESQLDRAHAYLADHCSLVPQGEVLVGGAVSTDSDSEISLYDEPPRPGTVYHVEPFFLDRYPVTNREYAAFVKAGGYSHMAIWDPQVWPAVFDFVDSTGHPGPRYWKQGTYNPGEEDFPVVGICWYEAAAFSRWVGKRLPSDAEWEKAASWPMQLSAGTRPQRRFPWGDTMDTTRCNVWGSGPGRVVSVREFASGESVGGVHQLIGNVWEWTANDFGAEAFPSQALILPRPMKSLRGGAFDTYFATQANCQFQSGDDSLARRHNIGFRCALSVCDVAFRVIKSDESVPAENHEQELAEVTS